MVQGIENVLPDKWRLWGVVRQQLLLDERIPFTTRNSSACAIVELIDKARKKELLSLVLDYIKRESHEKSDPGLCFVSEGEKSLADLMSFGLRCTKEIVTQEEALKAAGQSHLSGHGGTNGGVIGAAAAVGLTVYDWSVGLLN